MSRISKISKRKTKEQRINEQVFAALKFVNTILLIMIFLILYNYYNYCNNNPIEICHMLLQQKILLLIISIISIFTINVVCYVFLIFALHFG